MGIGVCPVWFPKTVVPRQLKRIGKVVFKGEDILYKILYHTYFSIQSSEVD